MEGWYNADGFVEGLDVYIYNCSSLRVGRKWFSVRIWTCSKVLCPIPVIHWIAPAFTINLSQVSLCADLLADGLLAGQGTFQRQACGRHVWTRHLKHGWDIKGLQPHKENVKVSSSLHCQIYSNDFLECVVTWRLPPSKQSVLPAGSRSGHQWGDGGSRKCDWVLCTLPTSLTWTAAVVAGVAPLATTAVLADRTAQIQEVSRMINMSW